MDGQRLATGWCFRIAESRGQELWWNHRISGTESARQEPLYTILSLKEKSKAAIGDN